MLRIKELLRERDMTNITLAKLAGISKTSANKVVSGNGNPSIDTLQRIADVLEVHITDLFERPDEMVNALIEHKGKLYKASTIEGLRNLVKKW